jgi:hypothetical protein
VPVGGSSSNRMGMLERKDGWVMNLEVMKIMPIIHMDYTNVVYIKKKKKNSNS